jgi:hypothetical protein
MFCHTKTHTLVKDLRCRNLKVVCYKSARFWPLIDPLFMKCQMSHTVMRCIMTFPSTNRIYNGGPI